MITKTSPDAGAVSSKYDQAGNLRYSQDANQAAAGQVFYTNYDFANRPLVSGQASAAFSSLDPFSSASFEGTTGNWLVRRKYDAKPATDSVPWSLFSNQINALTLSNVSGRLAAVASKSNGSWQVTLFSYDVDGRVVKRYQYTHANGGTSVLTALNTTDTLTLDLRGAVTQRGLTVGSNTWYQWYDYDTRGLLWKVSDSTSATKPGTPDVTYTYRPSGQVASRQFRGGPAVPLTYTIRERLDSIGNPSLTTYPFSARYVYQLNGVVDTAEFYSGGSPATYKRYRYAFGSAGYDALNRLKSADYAYYNAGWQSTLAYDLTNVTYDATGNLKSLRRYRQDGTLIDQLGKTIASTSNRLTSVYDTAGTTTEPWDAEGGSLTYDANGNLTTAPAPYNVSATGYDYQNLPLWVKINADTTKYRYTEAGQRIAKQVGTGNREMYVLDGATQLGVVTVNSSGTPVSWYWNVVAADKVVGRQPNTGNRRYYHTDLLGSTRAVVDGSTQTIVESYDYDPWGVLMPGRTLGSGTKEGFTGKERDPETGLDYFGARYYGQAFGRWAAVDPLVDEYAQWSSYSYVLDNPASSVDATGLSCTRAGDERLECKDISSQDLNQIKTFLAQGGKANGTGESATNGGSPQPSSWWGAKAAEARSGGAKVGLRTMQVLAWIVEKAAVIAEVTGLAGYNACPELGMSCSVPPLLIPGAVMGIDPPTSTPVGSLRARMTVPEGTNAPEVIGGRLYTGHAFDRMQAYGLTPTVVENAIAHGVETAGREGARIFADGQLRVILNPNGSVKTVMPFMP